MSVVWECGSCGTRSLERRCSECNLFCSKVGAGAECSELIAIAELMASAGSGGDVPTDLVIGVDELDAVGLAGVLDYIAEWLTEAPPAVAASLGDHGGGPGASEVLLEALARHSRALTAAVPS